LRTSSASAGLSPAAILTNPGTGQKFHFEVQHRIIDEKHQNYFFKVQFYQPKISLILSLVVLPTKPVPLVNPQGAKMSEAYFS